MAKAADRYFRVDPWQIIEEGFDPGRARVSESIFSLANETTGVRGFFDEGGTVDSLRGAYVNGLYDEVPLPGSYRGIIDRTHFMIPAADWLMTGLTLDGEALDLGRVRFRDFRRVLDLRTGVLTRSFVWETAGGKALRVTFLRAMDMAHRERACQRIRLEPLNFSGEIRLTSGLSFATVHEGQGRCFWQQPRSAVSGQALMLQARTGASGQELFAGALLSVPGEAAVSADGFTASLSCTLPLTQGEVLQVDKQVVLLFTGETGEALRRAGEAALADAAAVSVDETLAAQAAWWAARWRNDDLTIEAADDADAEAVRAEQQGIRFCAFQLAQTYNGGSMQHNIGAKGLTGEAYNGHAFWDTEACCLPFYLFTNPAAARDLLLFRYHTLPRARARARMLDCEGACYPIATLSGDEACALWQHASLQPQPSTAVAYGIWHYVRVTGDEDFLFAYGAEMLLELARFLASRAARGEQTGCYGFYGVMGPDEFHLMVNNNAYTNYMGKRTLEYAAEVLTRLRSEQPAAYAALAEKTGLQDEEIARWQVVAEGMYIPRTDTGLIEQHDGFFNLPHTDVDAIPVTDFPLYSHWSYDRIFRTDLIKQPDVLMMLYLYNTSFTAAEKRVNYDYYTPRTIHESSLSPAIHAILASELGKMDEAVNLFGYATRLDLDNYNRNTHEGLHITSIAMAWAGIVYGFAGLRSDGEVLRFAPHLPDRWKSLRFSLLVKGQPLTVCMTPEGTVFRQTGSAPLTLMIYDRPYTLTDKDCFVPCP